MKKFDFSTVGNLFSPDKYNFVDATISDDYTSNAHHNYIKSILSGESFQIVTSPNDESKGVLVVHNDLNNNNSLKIYTVEIYDHTNGSQEFNVTNYINEVYGIDIISKRNGVERVNPTNSDGSSSAFYDLKHSVNEAIHGRTVFASSVNSSYNDLVKRSVFATVGKVSNTKRFNSNKPVTFHLSENSIIDSLESTSNNYSINEGNSLFKSMDNKYGVRNINNSDELFEAIRNVIVDKIVGGNSPFANSSLYRKFNANGFFNGGFSDLMEAVSSETANSSDSYGVSEKVQKSLFAIKKRKNTVTMSDFTKVLSDVSASVGFDISDNKRSLTSFEENIINSIMTKISSHLTDNKETIDKILSEKDPNRLKQAILDIMRTVDTRATSISVASHMSGTGVITGDTNILADNKISLKPTLFHSDNVGAIDRPLFRNTRSSENETTILKNIDTLKKSDNQYKKISEINSKDIRVAVYNYFTNSDAVFVSDNLSESERTIVKHLESLNVKILKVSSDPKLSKSIGSMNLHYSKYSYIGSFKDGSDKVLVSLLKVASAGFKGRVYTPNSSLDIGVEFIGPNSSVLPYRFDKKLRDIVFDGKKSPIARVVNDLKTDIINSLRDSGKSDVDILKSINFFKGRSVRYSDGGKNQFMLNVAITNALNSINPSDISDNPEQLIIDYNKITSTSSVHDHFASRNISVLSQDEKHIIDMLEDAKRNSGRMVFFDIETTGFDFRDSSIDDISLVGPSGAKKTLKIKMSSEDVKKLVNSPDFESWASVRNLDKTTVEDDFLRNSSRVTAKEAYSEIHEFLKSEAKLLGIKTEELILSGHNIDSFDIPFLTFEASKHNKDLFNLLNKTKTFDTYLDLFANVFPNLSNRKLGYLYSQFVGKISDPSLLHTAEFDTISNKELFVETMKRVHVVKDSEELKKILPIIDSNGKLISQDSSTSKIYIIPDHLQSEYKKLLKLKNTNTPFNVSDLLNPQKVLEIAKESSSPSVVIDELKSKGFSVTYHNGYNYLNVAVGSNGTPIRIPLGKYNEFHSAYTIEHNIGKSGINDLVEEFNKIIEIRDTIISNGYIKPNSRLSHISDNPLALLSDAKLNSVKDLEDFLFSHDKSYVELFSEADKRGMYTHEKLLTFVNKLRELHNSPVSHIIDYLEGDLTSSHSFSNKAGQLANSIFFKSPLDYINLGQGLSKESIRSYQSMDLKTINPNNLHNVIPYSKMNVVSGTSEAYFNSINKNVGSYDISHVKSKAIIGFAPELWGEDSAVITKKAALSIDNVKEFKSVLNLKGMNRDYLIGLYSGVEFKNGFSHSELTKLGSNTDIFNYVKANAIDSFSAERSLLSNDAKYILYLTEQKNKLISESIGQDFTTRHSLLKSFDSKIEFIKNSRSKGLSLGEIITNVNSMNFTYAHSPHTAGVHGEDRLVQMYYDSFNSLYDGSARNHKVNIFNHGINSSVKKLDTGLDFIESSIENGNLIFKFNNTHFFGPGDKINFYGDKAAGTHLVDKIVARTTDGVVLNLDVGMDLAISDRGLYKYKSFALISSAIGNMEHDSEVLAFIDSNKKAFKALGIDSVDKVNGRWVINDVLTRTMKDAGFKDTDDLLHFLTTEKGRDLFQKNQNSFDSVHSRVHAEYGSFDNLMHQIDLIYKKVYSGATVNPILANIEEIGLVNNGHTTVSRLSKPQLFVLPSSRLNAMNDENTFEHGEALKFSYFADSLLSASGYSAFKNSFMNKNLSIATEYLSAVDHVSTNKKLGIIADRSIYAYDKYNYDVSFEIYKNALLKTTSSKQDYSSFDGHNIKRKILLDLDSHGLSHDEIHRAFSDVDTLFEHSVYSQGSGKRSILVSNKSEAKILSSIKDGWAIDRINLHPEYKNLTNSSEFKFRLLSHKASLESKDFSILLFKHNIGRIIAENNGYNTEAGVIDANISVISKRNLELYNDVTASMRNYLSNSVIVKDPKDVRFKTISFFNKILSGEKANYSTDVLSEIGLHLNSIQESIVFSGNKADMKVLSGIISLKNLISSVSGTSNDAFASDTINSFFINKGFVVKDFNLGIKVNDDGSFIDDVGFKALSRFISSYEKQSVHNDVYFRALEDFNNKNFSKVVKTFVDATDLGTFTNHYDSVESLTRNLKIYKAFVPNSSNINSYSEFIKTYRSSLDSLEFFEVGSEAHTNALNILNNEFSSRAKILNKALNHELSQIDDIDFFNNTDNFKKISKTIIRLIDSDNNYNSYSKSLFTTDSSMYSLSDRLSPFYEKLRERTSDSVGHRIVKSSGTVEDMLKLLFKDGELNKENFEHFKSIFGNAVSNLLTENIPDEILDDVKNNLSEFEKKNITNLDLYATLKHNLNFIDVGLKKSSSNTYSEFVMKARHPMQSSLHFSSTFVINVGEESKTSLNPFEKLFYSLTSDFRDENTILIFGDTTMKRMMGDYDSDKIYIMKSEAINENLQIFDFHSYNQAKYRDIKFHDGHGSFFDIASHENETTSDFLKRFGKFSDDTRKVSDNIDFIIGSITETSESFVKERRYLAASNNYLFKSVLKAGYDSQVEPELNRFISDVFKTINAKEFYEKTEKTNSFDLFVEHAEEYLKNTKTHYSINFLKDGSLDTSLFKRTNLIEDSISNFYKTAGIHKTGSLYNYVLKVKSINETLVSIYNAEANNRVERGVISPLLDDMQRFNDASVRLSEKMYSASIQAIIGAKKGKSLDLDFLKSLVRNLQSDDSLGKEFDSLFKSVYKYYIDGDSTQASSINKFFENVDIDEKYLNSKKGVFGDIFKKIFSDKISVNSDLGKEHYASTGLSILLQEYKFGSFEEIASSIKSGDLNNVAVKNFLTEFSAFFSGIYTSQKVVDAKKLNIIGSLEISLGSDVPDEVKNLMKLIKSDSFNTNIFATKPEGAVYSEYDEYLKKIKDNEAYSSINKDIDEFIKLYKFISPMEREDKNAFLVDPEVAFFKNQDEKSLYRGSHRLKEFYDLIDNKFYKPLNGESSLVYAKKVEEVTKSFQAFVFAYNLKSKFVTSNENSIFDSFFEFENHLSSLKKDNLIVSDILSGVSSGDSLRSNAFFERISDLLDKSKISLTDSIDSVLDKINYNYIESYVGGRDKDEFSAYHNSVEANIRLNLDKLKLLFKDKLGLTTSSEKSSVAIITESKPDVETLDDVLFEYSKIASETSKYERVFNIAESESYANFIKESDLHFKYDTPEELMRNIFNNRDTIYKLPSDSRSDFLNNMFAKYNKTSSRESYIVEMFTKNFDNFSAIMHGDFQSFINSIHSSIDSAEDAFGSSYDKINKVNLFNYVVYDKFYEDVKSVNSDFVQHVEKKIDSLFDEDFVKNMKSVFNDNKIAADDDFVNTVKSYYKRSLVTKMASAENYETSTVDDIIGKISVQRNNAKTYEYDQSLKSAIISAIRESNQYGTESIYDSAVRTSDNIVSMKKYGGIGLIAAALLSVGHHCQQIRSRKFKDEIDKKLYSKEQLRAKLEESFRK